MVEPGVTGSGVSSLVTERSTTAGPGAVVSVSLSLPGFGSVVAEETVTVLEILGTSARFGLAVTTIVNTALPMAMLGVLQETAPLLAPTAGVVHDQPAGAVKETNVVLAGTLSVSVADVALLG